MKRCTYLLFPGLIVVGLFLTANPALAQVSLSKDGMPHNDYDSGSTSTSPGQCIYHMTDPRQLGAPTPVFKLCANNSGASSWSFELRSDISPYPLVSGCSWGSVAVDASGKGNFSSASCTVPTPGYYRGIIRYTVNGSPFSHTDRRFHR